jgi:flavin reductase (DIM6/NTAB) family NADH-FMN oxidoreductase RutF
LLIDPSDLAAEQSYKLLTGIVVPRPIAWVTTRSLDGVVNLAPFSAFTFVSPKPPMLAISIGLKAGIEKDTARNILATNDFVVNIADQSHLGALHQSADEYPSEISEVNALGLETVASDLVGPPRLASTPVAMECVLRHDIEFGEIGSRLLVGEVLRFHVRDGLMRGGKIDTIELDPIARIAGPNYATLGRLITMPAIRQTLKS